MENIKKRNQFLKLFAKENKLNLSLILFFGLIASALLILIPISVGKFYNLFFNVASRRAFVLDVFPSNWVSKLPNFLYFFFALVIIWTISSFFQRYLTAKLGEILVKHLRERLFKHQLSVGMRTYDETGFGKYLLRYSGDMNSIKRYVTNGLVRFSIDFILILFTIVAMLLTDVYLTAIIGAGIAVIISLVYILNKLLYTISLELRNKKSGLLSFVSTRLPSILTIKIFNRKMVEQNSFVKRSEKIYTEGIKYQRVNALISALIPGLLYATIGFLLVAIYLFQGTSTSIQGDHLLGFILLFITVQPVFRRVLKAPSQWKLGNISFEKYFNVLNLKIEKSDLNGRKFKLKKGGVRFKKVSYGFSPNENVLSEVELSIKGASTTLICSSKNLPKSTLIKLITGVYFPSEGVISIDSQSTTRLDLKSLRRNINVLSEDVPLLGRTVFEACSYSKAKSKRPNVQEILDYLQKEIPNELKMNLDFKIGDRGEKLNLMQNQVLVAERSILLDKPILLIESLSKMEENPAFNKIILKLEEFKKEGKTILVFEDKLSNLKLNFFDETIVL